MKRPVEVLKARAVLELAAFATKLWGGYKPARHHHKIAEALERVARGELKRLMIFMPPRHGKSMLASEFFPAWYLGRNPTHQVIAATYAQGLADDFGRKVRNIMQDPGFAEVFPGTLLADDSQAANRFHLSQRGAYFAVGAGGPITGRGADLLLIDDPIKGREDAESETMRQRLKDWYTSVARTRLMPGGAIVVIQCMTGDTPVMRPDGTETPLRDIRRGDKVATFEDGRISVSTVLNWANNGPDNTLEITTESGIIVKANGRHPFLVQAADGSHEWVRAMNLNLGQNMLRARKASGRAKRVAGRIATFQLSAVAIATIITSKFGGPVATGPHRLTQPTYGIDTSSIVTASASITTTNYWPSSAASARFATNSHQQAIPDRIGATSCVSIIAMTARRCAVCCAMTAIWRSAMARRRKFLSQPLNTYGVTLDQIVKIASAGVEEVFDIQVDRTENFIANGLVSHNTRWHEDDLAGWLLKEHQHENWETLNLPAIAEPGDALKRTEGEALWPTAYPVSELAVIRKSVGGRDWSALYQQRPSAAEGSVFKREHWRYYQPTESEPKALISALGCFQVVQAWDTAFKKGSLNDYSVGVTIGISPNRYYVLDCWRDRLEFPDLKRAVMSQAAKWGATAVLVEDTAAGQSLLQELGRNTRLPLIPVKADRDKVSRASAVTPTHEAGLCYLPGGAHWLSDFVDELASFPSAPHDDQVDAWVHGMSWAMQANPPEVQAVEEDEFFGRASGMGWMA